VHPPGKRCVALGIEAAVEPVDRAVELPDEPWPVEHERPTDRAEVVDVMKRPRASVQHRRDAPAERFR
jgi:hypothetical protein